LSTINRPEKLKMPKVWCVFYCYRVIGVNKIINIKERLNMTIKVIIKNILKIKKNKKPPRQYKQKQKTNKQKQNK